MLTRSQPAGSQLILTHSSPTQLTEHTAALTFYLLTFYEMKRPLQGLLPWRGAAAGCSHMGSLAHTSAAEAVWCQVCLVRALLVGGPSFTQRCKGGLRDEVRGMWGAASCWADWAMSSLLRLLRTGPAPRRRFCTAAMRGLLAMLTCTAPDGEWLQLHCVSSDHAPIETKFASIWMQTL